MCIAYLMARDARFCAAVRTTATLAVAAVGLLGTIDLLACVPFLCSQMWAAALVLLLAAQVLCPRRLPSLVLTSAGRPAPSVHVFLALAFLCSFAPFSAAVAHGRGLFAANIEALVLSFLGGLALSLLGAATYVVAASTYRSHLRNAASRGT